MSVITRAQHPAASWPGVKSWFGQSYEEWEPIWSQIYDSSPTSKSYEESIEDVPFGLLSTKTESGGILYDQTHQGYTQRLTQVTYALGYKVTLEEILFNQYEEISLKRAGRLARSVRETEETLHAQIFNRAFDASYTYGDGTTFISSAHPVDGANQSNAADVDSDLNEAAIEDLVIKVRDTKDARGLRISSMARRLIVHHNNMFESTRILKSTLQNDTANNAVNALKQMNIFSDGVVINPYHTDTDAWFIQTQCDDGLVHYTGLEATFDKDNEFDTKNACASVVCIFSHGFNDWRCLFASQGA